MSYWTISVMAGDPDLTARVTACAAQETSDNPYAWTSAHMLALAAEPGWSEAWEYAVNNGATEGIGQDPAVVSDSMILSAVQALIAKDEAESAPVADE